MLYALSTFQRLSAVAIMLPSRNLLATKLKPFRPVFRPAYNRHRSTTKQSGSEPIFPEDTLVKQTSFFVDLSKRFIKFSAIGACALALTGWAVFEGTQLWVEHIELASEQDEETRRWEWDIEPENWRGTDPSLGYRGRHSVRAAWMAQNWGSGRPGSVITEAAHGPGGLNVVDADLARAQSFLSTATSIAEERSIHGKVRPQTVATLLALHASALERMSNMPEYVTQAKTLYARAWASSLGKGPLATYIAARLGDINRRLGQSSDALAWWARAIHLIQGSASKETSEMPVLPKTLPPSPYNQRVLTSILVSLSAFYATSGRLQDARIVEEGSLRLLRSVPSPEALATATPPQALHALFLVHRSSLLSIHLAEVLHSQKHAITTSIQWLKDAAESSERVVLVLAGFPLDNTKIRPIQYIPSRVKPLREYSASRSLRRPAANLLRDARRTSVEAWTLMGILSEQSDPRGALECYERAMLWAGIGTNTTEDESLESEWRSLQNNYTRLKERIQGQSASS